MALTPGQVTRLDEIYRESLPARRRLREQLTGLRNTLDRMLAEGRIDDDGGRAIIERVYAVEKQRNIARTLLLLRMYRVLSPAQQVRLSSLAAFAAGPGSISAPSTMRPNGLRVLSPP